VRRDSSSTLNDEIESDLDWSNGKEEEDDHRSRGRRGRRPGELESLDSEMNEDMSASVISSNTWTFEGLVVFSILTLAALVSLGFPDPTAKQERPLALHPDNPHYFLFRGKPTVLITSGEHYGAVLNLDFDHARYLDELQANGLNHTRTFAGSYREAPGSFKITENTLAPGPNRYTCPWARSSTPGYFDGGNKFDLKRWDDDYFKRLKDFLMNASRRGVVVELNLFCPNYDDALWKANPMHAANNVNDIGKCPGNEVYTLKHKDLLAVHEAVTRKIVRELQDFDNLYYEVCNEPYFGGVTMEWQQRIVDVIVDAEKALPQRHLISMNVANGRAKVSKPHPAVSLFNFHYCVPPDVVEMNYGLNKPIGENETGFRGKKDVTYRTEGWDFILAGGALYNNLDYSFTCKHPDGKFLEYTSPGGGSPELRRQLKVLKGFIESFDFVRMAPNNAVIKEGVPKGATARALVEAGKQYAVYLKGGKQADLQLDIPGGTYTIEWLDTKTGGVAAQEKREHNGGKATFRSPEYAEDIALRIKASQN
jgi:hypothetical protein